jgi:hypothetical protein
MRDLYEIEVRITKPDPYDPGHVELVVEPAFSCENADEFGPPTNQQAAVALEHLAGILARLYVLLHRWIDLERQTHGCRGALVKDCDGYPAWWDSCAISAADDATLHPGRAWDTRPGVWLMVPVKRAEHWLEQIRQTLEQIAEPSLASTEAVPASELRTQPSRDHVVLHDAAAPHPDEHDRELACLPPLPPGEAVTVRPAKPRTVDHRHSERRA